MEPQNQNQDDLFYQLGLALLELLDKPIDLELSRHKSTNGLILNGTLLRAFDTPAQASLSLTIGAHTISIRPSTLKTLHITRSKQQPSQIQSLHLLFTDQYTIHIKPTNS